MNPDTLFPTCCYTCPHYQETDGTCGHQLRQAIRQQLMGDTDQPCPIFQTEQAVDSPGQ